MQTLHHSQRYNIYQRQDGKNDTALDRSLEVNCVWPLSGQYGAGSRILYYALILTCVLARKQDWIKGPCLVATLLIPAVAALHGVVLAAVHTPGAVDMDLYGVFQVCSIGVLTALETLMQSRTYFDGSGRNMIFIWSGLILAGLLSLTVEFYRTEPAKCPVFYPVDEFPYGNETCGLTCSVTNGPFSPIRTSLGTNIAVIPSPTKLTFNTAMLLSAACCIPAILSLIFVWMKILENRKKDSYDKQTTSSDTQPASYNRQIEYDSTARPSRKMVYIFRHNFEMPLFIGAVMAILIFGERNLLSKQCRYMTEPLDSIGQWGPVVGTGLAIMGSLYILFEAAIKEEENVLRQAAGRERQSSQAECVATGSTQGIFHSLARLYVRKVKSIVNSTEPETQENAEAQVLDVPGESDRNENYKRTSEQRSRKNSRECSPSHDPRFPLYMGRRGGYEGWPLETSTSWTEQMDSTHENSPAVNRRQLTLNTAALQTQLPLSGPPGSELTYIGTNNTQEPDSAITRVPTIVVSPVDNSPSSNTALARGTRSVSEPTRSRTR